jgi:ribosomal protein L17
VINWNQGAGNIRDLFQKSEPLHQFPEQVDFFRAWYSDSVGYVVKSLIHFQLLLEKVEFNNFQIQHPYVYETKPIIWLFSMARADSDTQEATEPGGATSGQRKLSVKEQLLLHLLQQTSMWQKDLADKLKKKEDRISGPLAELKEEGYIDNVPTPPGKKGKYWALVTKNDVLIKLFHDKKYPTVVTGMRSSVIVAETVLGAFPDLPQDIKPILIKMIRLSPDFFEVILENLTYDQLSPVCSPYLVPSSFGGQMALKVPSYFTFYQLFAESLIRERKRLDVKKEYETVLEELKTALSQHYTDRTDLQKKKEIIDTIEKMIQEWKKGNIENRERLVTNCSRFQDHYELIDKNNDPDPEIKLKLEEIYTTIQSLITYSPPLKRSVY